MQWSNLWRITLTTVAILATVFAIRWIDRLPQSRLASVVNILSSPSSPTPAATVLVVPPADRASALSIGTVAVQTFHGATLIRSGSGTIVSSDGLIVTTSAVAPYGSGSFVYQVVTSRGAFLKARRVVSDVRTGLVLLKVEASDLATTAFDDIALRPGEDISIVGAVLAHSRYVPALFRASVAYVVDARTVTLSLDRANLSHMAGARITNQGGNTVGIIRQGTDASIIDAASVNVFIAKFLGSTSPTPGR